MRTTHEDIPQCCITHVENKREGEEEVGGGGGGGGGGRKEIWRSHAHILSTHNEGEGEGEKRYGEAMHTYLAHTMSYQQIAKRQRHRQTPSYHQNKIVREAAVRNHMSG